MFCKIMTEDTWSPIEWLGGKRAKKNFLRCDYLALDFDDGRWTLESTKEWVMQNKFAAIIGTSKSHQIEKVTKSGIVKPPVDRFRLVIPFSECIVDREQYEYNMSLAMATTPCDPSCKDGARYFFPCKEITFASPGENYPVASLPSDYERQAVRQKRQNKKMEVYQGSGIIPSWALFALERGVPEGGRHTMCYRLGATLPHAGWHIERIIELVMDSPIGEIGEHDVRRAVENGSQANPR